MVLLAQGPYSFCPGDSRPKGLAGKEGNEGLEKNIEKSNIRPRSAYGRKLAVGEEQKLSGLTFETQGP
ncbi:uncharacterized protein ColSpa_12554 [Colletotrichum spaethianum]|uniref:Uncharacterized protein n=1 Tax=Colletotrichum spaethianum TaxID=700344 RepID=A0AA37PHD6_9PEZI|nr:uncharacterized protein ColSpa_12554 [Colletotrichum spaethianum]GKT52373.1 hypothetical protein ColSpa_12554 [Colletotrichum spaethianum]